MESINLDTQLGDLRKDLKKYVNTLSLDNEEQTLVQETFVRAIVGRQKHKLEGYLGIWSNTLLRKAFINNYNRLIMNGLDNDPNKNIFMLDNDSDEDQEPVFNKIVRNIERLNPRLKEPFKMNVEGYNYKEIADAVNIKIETVEKRIFIARTQLMLQNI